MRVLLDECVPRAPRKARPGHDVRTVGEAQWAGVKNGALLRLAETAFDVLLTVDRNLEYRQNFSGLKIAVVVIEAPANDVAVLRPLMAEVCEAISKAQPGAIACVGGVSLRAGNPSKEVYAEQSSVAYHPDLRGEPYERFEPPRP